MNFKRSHRILLGAILLFVSCVKENVELAREESEAILRFAIPAETVSVEDFIGKVRIATFGVEESSIAGVLDVNSGPLALSEPHTLHTGVRDVYVFSNEDDALTEKFDAMRNLSDLAAIQIPYNPPMTAPFFGIYKTQLEIKSTGNAPISGSVKRAVCKIKLLLNYRWGEEADVLPKELMIDKVQVKHLPNYSYVVGKAYDGGVYDYKGSEILEGSILANKSTTPTKEYKSDTLTIYIPEFLGASASHYAYIEILGHVVGGSTISRYIIPLGGEMESNGTVIDYGIPRNTAFQINATIKSYGELNNIIVETNVKDWNRVDNPVEVGRYAKINKIVAADMLVYRNSTKTTITKGVETDLFRNPNSKINYSGDTIAIYYNTNIDDLSAKFQIEGQDVQTISLPVGADSGQEKCVKIYVPANFGVEGVFPLPKPRKINLKINYPANMEGWLLDPENNINNMIDIHCTQGAVVWSQTNLGAATMIESGFVYQFNRNQAFPAPEKEKPLALVDTHEGPISARESETTYASKYIFRGYNGSITTNRIWSDASGAGNLWQRSNPCTMVGNNYVMPSGFDLKGLFSDEVGREFTKVDGVSGFYFGFDPVRIFIPIRGYREWYNQGMGQSIAQHGFIWSLTPIDEKAEEGWCVRITNQGGLFVLMQPYTNAYGFPIRCVKYID